MGVAFGTYGGQERRIQGFWWGNLRERDHLEDPDVCCRIIVYFYCYVYIFLLLSMFCSLYSVSVLLCVLFVCKFVLYYYHGVSIQLQLTNISYHILRAKK